MSRLCARFAARLGGFALDAALDVPAQGVTALFGPSGCGKTTLLRAIAGLARLPGGLCRMGDETWQEGRQFTPVHERPIGMVFQDARLFSHLDVAGNLRFGLARAQTGGIAWEDVVAFLGLGPLLARRVGALSGGERQRVALGRALLAQPRLLLMDEPLAALDAGSVDEIIPPLRALSARFGVPVVYVSHDMGEVERIADHLVLMAAGRVTAAGPLGALLTDLSLGLPNTATVLDTRITGFDPAYELTSCAVDGVALVVPGRLGDVGARLRLIIRAEQVALAATRPTASSVLNQLPARVLDLHTPPGPYVTVKLAIGEGGPVLLARITRLSRDHLALTPGAMVMAQVKASALGVEP
jgi:molybdate transport system ATP-binding protein